MISVQREPFDIAETIEKVKSASSSIGALVVFVGTARDISKGKEIEWLEFEHYPGMAEKQLESLRESAIERFGLIEAAIIHRCGRIEIGEDIVLIVAAAGHRAEAFEACRWCIDELKRIVPIWKKEKTSEGEVWVEEHP
ncbi:MAG: molybdenum cofactor biosynthesis protein MoaE [Actinobacteria bacterium]|nr:MAG: molybdenum cofactor biosynthesis protein MoaE [Actinomycetota bacterium]